MRKGLAEKLSEAILTSQSMKQYLACRLLYHQLVEEAYAALGLIETQVDELRAELEYQHRRLDEARDAAFAEATRREE